MRLHEEDRRALLLGAYYARLNQDRDCQADLRALADRVADQLTSHDPPFPTEEIYPALLAFVRRWHLPRDYGLDDL